MEVLEIILYVLGSILLATLIVLSVKLIKSVDRINLLLDEVENKIKTVNKVFSVVDKVADSFAIVSDRIVDVAAKGISGLFRKKSKYDELEDDE